MSEKKEDEYLQRVKYDEPFLDKLAQIGGWEDFDRMFRNSEHIDDEVKIYFNMCCILNNHRAIFSTIKKVNYNELEARYLRSILALLKQG